MQRAVKSRDELVQLLNDEYENMNKVDLPPLPKYPLDLHKFPHNQDPLANQTLKKFHMDIVTAVATSRQDSFFKAISTCLFGTEACNYHLRYLTALWFGQNTNILNLYPDFSSISVLDVAESLVYVDFKINPGTVFAVVNAFSLSLTSIYPPHNGLFDPHFSLLNRVFEPVTNSNSVLREVCLLWVGENVKVENKKTLWEPKGFVCCFPCGLPYKTKTVSNEQYFQVPTNTATAEADENICNVSDWMTSPNGKDLQKVDEIDIGDLAKHICENKRMMYTLEFKNFYDMDQRRARKVANYLLTNQGRALTRLPDKALKYSRREYFNFVVRQKSLDDVIDDQGRWKAMSSSIFYFTQQVGQQLTRNESGLYCEVINGVARMFPVHPQPSDVIVVKVTAHHDHRTRHFVRKVTSVGGVGAKGLVLALYEYSHLTKLADI